MIVFTWQSAWYVLSLLSIGRKLLFYFQPLVEVESPDDQPGPAAAAVAHEHEEGTILLYKDKPRK